MARAGRQPSSPPPSSCGPRSTAARGTRRARACRQDRYHRTRMPAPGWLPDCWPWAVDQDHHEKEARRSGREDEPRSNSRHDGDPFRISAVERHPSRIVMDPIISRDRGRDTVSYRSKNFANQRSDRGLIHIDCLIEPRFRQRGSIDRMRHPLESNRWGAFNKQCKHVTPMTTATGAQPRMNDFCWGD